jgi:hypothetical protein
MYQWQDSIALGTWQNVSEAGGNTTSFTTDPLSQTTFYRVFVSASENGCEDVWSNVVPVVEFPDIQITGQAVGGSLCEGGIWNLIVLANGAPNLLYQWQDSTVTGTWQNVSEPGGNSSGFTTDPLNETTFYRLFLSATENGCEDLFSATVTIQVFNDIQLSGLSNDGSICENGTWNLSVTAVGSPNILYQWQDSIALGTWQNVSEPGGNTPNFTTDPLTQTTYYRVFVYATELGCEDLYSATVTVTVFNDIQITGLADGGSICTGGTWVLMVLANGARTDYINGRTVSHLVRGKM